VEDLTGSLGMGDVGKGGGTSADDKSSEDLDNDDEVVPVYLLGLPVTGDISGVPVPTTTGHGN